MARQKRKRKRSGVRPARTEPAVPAAAKPESGPRAKPAAGGPPPPLWGDFPLVPLVVLGGLIVMVFGLFTASPDRVLIGLAMGSLGGLEQAVREHFSGYRSHTTLLAGVGFAVTVGVTGYGFRLAVWVCLLSAAAVFAATAWLLRRRFITASGGLGYKLR